MTPTDARAHPWPEDGRWVELRWRKAVWPLIRPWYGYNNKLIPITAVERMTPITFWLPFFTLKTKYFHWYLGFKPITLDDPGFYWRNLDIVKKWRDEERQFVQLSWRWGIGNIS